MEEIILKVENLSVELDGKEVIKNLSFEVKRGDILTILGPNGAGKTTLLKTLLGILPYKGKIEWKEGIKTGYVPQRLPFIKDIPISILEFLKLKNGDIKKIKEILNSIGFEEDFLEKEMGELSSGQFQRILIAWVLLGDPDILLFDEPTSGIDILGKETIYQLLERLKKEKNLTILLVTHDLSVIYKFSNYVLCLNKCPICQGSPKEILTKEALQKLYGEEIKFYEHHKHE
ncbi:MAG TPA: metal ABC transporter ATP-binding protein [Candidatus Pacearchaeota archaeon]|nr:metal ABC transporter ATP-binding protein [Candidatus Pacearchaeota archaeon]HOK94393.1 metal ABC transporter ATP-binding protein [Candidatus Pacearchaeota archaeon]HPO75268.1 metal ABC transporter ATP-binding protein [Candidatus Pacearchaeota archaeon]